MQDLTTQLETLLRDAVAAALGPEAADVDPLLRPSSQPKFGDYQANLAMSLGKSLGRPPRELAQQIAQRLEPSDQLASVSVAGPGFLNLMVRDEVLLSQARAMAEDSRLGVTEPARPATVVLDYSAPNVAKEMHVGHLRSTVIGDALARVLRAVGHRVILQNHLGDWGTQFGMLITHLLDQGFDPQSDASPGELTALYKAAKQRFDAEPDFADRARQRVVDLQGGDAPTLAAWQALVDSSKLYFDRVYRQLDVLLQPQDARGESFYNPQLEPLMQRLDEAGHLQQSEGAWVVYPDGFTDRDDQPLPMLVRKSDGGFLYATTDLAAALYRIEKLRADWLVYVVGSPQRQHFAMLQQALRQFGWLGDDCRFDFVGFGSVLGPDKKMFKTRSGDTVRLIDLVEEAQRRAEAAIAEKNPDLPMEQRDEVARAVGIGALKYADLSSDRVKDYVFDWDRMLALDGNTAPYLLYSYARIRSIFRKGGVDFDDYRVESVAVAEPAERELTLQLLQFPGVVQNVADTLEPHRLCNYLYELATRYHRFFEHCPVLQAPDDTARSARLGLCHLTARVLDRGLGLLGIRVVEQM